MHGRSRNVSQFVKQLRALRKQFTEDLFLPSLRETPPRVQGYAFKYTLTLPLFSGAGRPVFLHEHLGLLHELLDDRFGGCSGTSYRSGAPYFGEYRPPGQEPERDNNTLTIVYANPIEASDRFFHVLKQILRRAPLIPQDEILIERSEVFLV